MQANKEVGFFASSSAEERDFLTSRRPGHKFVPFFMKLLPDSIVVASKDQMAADIAGEVVLLGVTAGRYYGLDSVGARVWQLIQAPTSIAEVVRTITAEYDVAPERCEADVLALFQKMIGAGLIEVRRADAT